MAESCATQNLCKQTHSHKHKHTTTLMFRGTHSVQQYNVKCPIFCLFYLENLKRMIKLFIQWMNLIWYYAWETNKSMIAAFIKAKFILISTLLIVLVCWYGTHEHSNFIFAGSFWNFNFYPKHQLFVFLLLKSCADLHCLCKYVF